MAEAPPAVLTDVLLPPLVVERTFRWDTEFRGLVTMAVELGLGDMPGVVPRVTGQAQPPSVVSRRAGAPRSAEARLVARGGPEALELELEVCVPGQGCESTRAACTRERPWEAIGSLLDGAAQALGVEVPDATRAAWRQPGSPDPYAELITGRSAATLYGLLPYETPAEGTRDVVTRAVLIDPRQPLAQWALARWDAGATADGGRAFTALQRAMLARPGSPLLAADLATLLDVSGRAGAAHVAWADVVSRDADDPRFLEPYARALLAVDRTDEARQVLESFPPDFAWNPSVAELKVAVAERVGGADGLDPLLEHWQRTDARAAEPVRRRIELRVRAGRYADALPLVAPLRARTPGSGVDALETALLVAVGSVEEAAARAPADVGARLLARAALEQDAGAVPSSLAATEPLAALVAADVAFARNAPAQAAAAVAPLVDAADGRTPEAIPVRAEAWLTQARASEALGRSAEAADAYARAWEHDPALPGGPVTPTRVTSTFRFVELAPGLDESAEGATGPAQPEAPLADAAEDDASGEPAATDAAPR